jgi:peptide/nickel transport system substrate-binding protein
MDVKKSVRVLWFYKLFRLINHNKKGEKKVKRIIFMKKSLMMGLILLLTLVVACSNSSSQPATNDNNGNNNDGQSQTNKNNDDNSSAKSSRDEIRVGLDVDAGTMDPRLARDTSARRVVEIAFDGLVNLNASLEPEPALAKSWENPDDVTWVFHLRDNVTFHDGTPFTAKDVKFTYDTILDENFNAPYRSLYTPIQSVEVIDDHTVKFTLNQPYAPLLAYLNLGIVPEHLARNEGFASNPVGTGPYKLVKWNKNNKIEFAVNENHWAGEPKTAKVVYFIIPDNTTRVAALEAGDVDLVHSPLSPQDIQRLKGDNRFVVEETSGLGFTYLNFNQQSEILSDLTVRKAIAHLINKQSISRDIYQGMDKEGTSPIIPPSWAFSDQVTDYPYDIEKAKQLFADAGWTDSNGDGILDKNGKKMTIELSTHTEDPNRIQTVEFLQYELSGVGIDVQVSTTEWPTFSTGLINNSFDIALVGWLGLVDPDRAMYNQFHSEGGNNYGKYSNARVDELLEQGRTTLNQQKRADIYQEAAQIINDEVAYNVVLYQGYIVMHSKNLEGFELHPSGELRGLVHATISE